MLTRTKKAIGYAAASVAAATGITIGAIQYQMSNNAIEAIAHASTHIESLRSYIDTGRLQEHTGFTTYIDASWSYERAEVLLEGITRIRDNIDKATFAIGCLDNQESNFSSYGWVYKTKGDLVIHYCNIAEYMLDSAPWWYYHEISHRCVEGMCTDDHAPEGYQIDTVLKWAVTDPDKALRNASSIENFLRSDPPLIAISHAQIRASMIPIINLIIETKMSN